tara:strand:- start:504 stop:980 length:477 start_codon:yes stop_codon:yes gene_type:complete
MFNSALLAANGAFNMRVGVGTDKFGSRHGFAADPNSSPAWNQVAAGSDTVTVFGELDNVFIKISGVYYQIVGFNNPFNSATGLHILHPNQSDTSALPFDLFTSITTDLGTLNTSDATAVNLNSSFGNPNFKVTAWTWNTPQTNLIGTSAGFKTFIITE